MVSGLIFLDLFFRRLKGPRLPKDVLDSPLVYTKSRDIHAAGIILLQMLLGRDIIDRYPDPQTAIRNGKTLTAFEAYSTHVGY